MSFSGLSREVRDLIYHELLCPPDGVRLHSRPRREQEATEGRYQKFELLGYDEYESQEEIRNEDGGNMNDLSGSWGFRNNEAAAATPVPTAIFCVNHQIRQEATEVFYRFNRFAFDIDARTALDFLKGLRPSSRRRVHDLGFACGSAYAYEYSTQPSGTPFPLSSLATCLYAL